MDRTAARDHAAGAPADVTPTQGTPRCIATTSPGAPHPVQILARSAPAAARLWRQSWHAVETGGVVLIGEVTDAAMQGVLGHLRTRVVTADVVVGTHPDALLGLVAVQHLRTALLLSGIAPTSGLLVPSPEPVIAPIAILAGRRCFMVRMLLEIGASDVRLSEEDMS